MVNTPIPASLKSEAKKAAKILREFTIPSAKVGPEKLIPAGLVSNAAGLAVLTVAKVGFLVTARGGSGIVIAKLEDDTWSAPSAIGIAGLGGGFEVGAEVTDFIIILNKRSAVQAFSKGGNLTLGGNFTIAAGPLGRNLEGDVSLRSTAAIYTYSKTKGLFAGISIEGSGLIERKDANRKFYGGPIRAYEILSGEVDRPPDCFELYEVLEKHDQMYKKAALAYAKRQAVSEAKKAATGSGLMAMVKSFRKGTPGEGKQSGHRGRSGSGTSYEYRDQGENWQEYSQKSDSSGDESPRPRSRSSRSTFYTDHAPAAAKKDEGRHQRAAPKARASPQSEESVWEKSVKVRALWAFAGEMPCDLIFRKGDEIDLLTRTATQEDWWEGKIRGRTGIFPANYVEILS